MKKNGGKKSRETIPLRTLASSQRFLWDHKTVGKALEKSDLRLLVSRYEYWIMSVSQLNL
jgi:hypothetical protein